MKTLIAIDPGQNGCICVYDNGMICRKMPDTPMDIYDLLYVYSRTGAICMLESVHGMPGQGGGAMFTFGRGFGWIEMALLALQIPTQTITPQKWQKPLGLGTKSKCSGSTEWKNKLKSKAQQLHPDVKITLWNADAVLIMDYFIAVCRKKLGQ